MNDQVNQIPVVAVDSDAKGENVFPLEAEKVSIEETIQASSQDLNEEFLEAIRREEEEVESLEIEVQSALGAQELSSDKSEDSDLSNVKDPLDETEKQEDGFHPLDEELTLYGKIEAILFASPKPLRTVEIHDLLLDQGYNLKEIQDALDELSEFYRDRGGGFHLKYVKRMGYQFQTTTAAKPLMEKQFSSRPRPLSRAALETLAVIAYRQKTQKSGVTRAEVEFIRGVDAGSLFKTLVERNLLTCVGRKEIPGRPMMFGVTDEFLKVFQLGSINDLPPLESFQTPHDVIQAANEKIAAFEAEQEGVNPEEFIGDEPYTEALGDGNVDVLSSAAPEFAPQIEGAVLADEKSEIQKADMPMMANDLVSGEILGLSPDTLAEIAECQLQDLSEDQKNAEILVASNTAVPKELVESISENLVLEFEVAEKSEDLIALPVEADQSPKSSEFREP